MISNHYPLIYNHSKNFAAYCFGSIGALTRHSMVTNGKINFCLFSQLLVCCSLSISQPKPATSRRESNFQRFLRKYTAHCSGSMPPCHSTNNTDDIFKTAQKGLVLESQEQIWLINLLLKINFWQI